LKTHSYLRNITLGTGLTALFLLVRCSVPGRDYSPLGIGENAGIGGASGSDGDGVLLSSAGRGGDGGDGGQAGLGNLDDAGGLGGSGGEPPVPIPCAPIILDAGTDAGTSDAGASDDAGAGDDPCECVDGFIRAVDTDQDGDGTRACSVAPGLDCDDGDNAVTHNACGGCTALPFALGTDCLDCGVYTCDGPDAVACTSKPGPVEDPDCRCLSALIVARDTDGDGQGTKLCEQNPGIDCNDGDDTFVTNACGGCESLPGHCLNTTTRQTCVGNGFWGADTTCANVCYQGNCEICTPGTYLCGAPVAGSHILYKCTVNTGSSSTGISWGSWGSCTASQTCDATLGQCTGYLLLPRDEDFDVVPLTQPAGLPWHDILNTASDSDYG
jgi:hypothetical protein